MHQITRYTYFKRSSKHEVDDIEKFTIINPHGSGEDIETLMMDPITDQIYLLTKNHEQPIAYIYKVFENIRKMHFLHRKLETRVIYLQGLILAPHFLVYAPITSN